MGGFIARTAIQITPSPFIQYSIGDVVTGVSALFGWDILSGEKLDEVDRGLYWVATAIPYIPATLLVLPIREIRISIENANHAYRFGDTRGAMEHSQNAVKSVKNLLGTVRKIK